VEEAEQVRIVAVVVDDETGVDPERAGLGIVDHDGVGVAAGSLAGLVEGHLVPLVEEVGAGQPGHTGPDHGDPPTPERSVVARGHGALDRWFAEQFLAIATR